MSALVAIREEQLNVRLNAEEMALARKLAEHYGLTPAYLVRMLIRERARDLGLEVAPPPAKARRSKRS